MFEGFTPETVDFLWGIRMNNNRDWFLEHKKQYTDTLYEPMKALAQELFVPYADTPGNMMKVSRIYRDARLHHPLPYKESLWCCVRRDGDYWLERPCVFLEINPDRVMYGFAVLRPKTEYMENFRKEISGRPREFLELMAKTEKETGIAVTAQLYKRPKETENEQLKPYFAWKEAIECICYEPISEDVFGRGLAERALDLFEKLEPVYSYFNRF